MKLRDLEKKIIEHELKNGATLAEASWAGANAIIAILDGDLDPVTPQGSQTEPRSQKQTATGSRTGST